MRSPQTLSGAAIILSLFFPFLVTAVGNLDCKDVIVDKVHWDLSKLGGPKSVMHSVPDGAIFKNTTYTIDLCRPLKRVSFDKIPEAQQCHSGTRVCAIERTVSINPDADIISHATPIAGDLKDIGGGDVDANWQRLKNPNSDTDSEKKGLRLTIHGGISQAAEKPPRTQKAVVEFLCDTSLEGNENLWDPEDKYEDEKSKRAETGNSSVPSLRFLKYDTTGEKEDVLFLEWSTKYACEDSKKEQDGQRSGHWGFFTWFILIAFLSTAAYLIFGSWLNYTRYGARGWDLLPHGDAIRDVPYLAKDLSRRVISTLQGGGRRGGYAAV